MATIECIYYDASYNVIAPKGNLDVTFREFAHSLLRLHDSMGSKINKALRYLGYLFQVVSDFTLYRGHLLFNEISKNAYDGCKRYPEIYGAAIATLIADKIYNYDDSHSIRPSSTTRNSIFRTRPDFACSDTKGNWALFEAKTSINHVLASTIDEGKKQLNNIASAKINGKTINTFKERLVVCTHLYHDEDKYVFCSVVDPNEEGTVEYVADEEALTNYRDFVREIVCSGKKLRRRVIGNDVIICSSFEINNHTMVIGMKRDLFTPYFINELSQQLDKMPVEETTVENDDGLFSDGVYIKMDQDFWAE